MAAEKYSCLREKLKEEARMKMREENRVMFSDYCPPPPPPPRSTAVGGSRSFLPPAAKRRRVLPPRVLQDQETTTAELSGKLRGARPSLSLSTAAAHTTCSSSPAAKPKEPAVVTPPERIGKNGLLIVRFKLTPEMRRIMATPPPPPTKKRPRENQEPTRRRSPMRDAPRAPQAAAAAIHERVSNTQTQTPPSSDTSSMHYCPTTPPLLPHHEKGITRTRSPEYYAPVWIPWTPLSPTVTWSPAYDPTYDPNNPSYDPSFTP